MTPSTENIELNSLYQEVILEHYKHPRFKGKGDHCQYCVEGKNPLCGDHITLYCSLAQGDGLPKVNLHFDGVGCSICQASASMMCEAVHEKNLEEVKSLLQYAEKIYTGRTQQQTEDLENDIDSLHGVSKFPVRIKCAALPWKTLELLIQENFDPQGVPKQGCDKMLSCVQNNTRKLKVVTTE